MTYHVLMCEPRHFRIDYEINPWMRRDNQVVSERALAQWGTLRDTLMDLGVRVDLVEQGETVPDMTFTANAGVAVGRRFIPSRFRFAQRQTEASLFSSWFAGHGYQVAPLPGTDTWEGEGDVLPAGDVVVAGYGFRTDQAALDALDRALGTEVVRLELVDPRFYHLDTCFCPLGEGRALYFPSAFTAAGRAEIERRFPRAFAVPEADALRFACNAVVVGDVVVMNDGCEATATALAAFGLRVAATHTGEFIKAGGSVKCLVLMLDGFKRWTAAS
jgi:N-dimethylarginine dimethylaminohydrolase